MTRGLDPSKGFRDGQQLASLDASSPVHRTQEEPQFFLGSEGYDPTADPSTEGGLVTCPTPGNGSWGYEGKDVSSPEL